MAVGIDSRRVYHDSDISHATSLRSLRGDAVEFAGSDSSLSESGSASRMTGNGVSSLITANAVGLAIESGTSNSSSSGTTGHASAPPKIGLIVGISAGAIVVLGVIYVLIFRLCLGKRRQKPSEATPRTYAATTTPTPVIRRSTTPQIRRSNTNSLPVPETRPETGLWDDPAIVVFRIPLDKVFVEQLVSEGGYGEVYCGLYKGQRVAVKKLQPAIRNDLKQINAFLAEAKIMASIEHKRLVRFVGVAWDSLRDLCVVTEFMEGGDLRSLLKQFDDRKSRRQGFDADKIKIAMHVAHALMYLHSLKPPVIHRDLKSRNILLDAELNAKLTDFGVSRESSDQTMTAGVGTTLWIAPEVMMGERYNEKADIFSFGVVLTELDSHQLPYASTKSTNSGRSLPDTAIFQKIAMGKLQAQFTRWTPQWLREIGTACLSLEPNDRPSAAELAYALQSQAGS